MAVADTGHRTAGGHYIFKVVKNLEHFFRAQRVLVLPFYPRNLVGYTPVHVGWGLLKYVSEAVLQRILVHPDARGQFVAAKIRLGSLISFLKRVSLFIFHDGLRKKYGAKLLTFFEKKKNFSDYLPINNLPKVFQKRKLFSPKRRNRLIKSRVAPQREM